MSSENCPLAAVCRERAELSASMVQGGTDEVMTIGIESMLSDQPNSIRTGLSGVSMQINLQIFQTSARTEEFLTATEDRSCTGPLLKRQYGLVGRVVSESCCSKARIARLGS